MKINIGFIETYKNFLSVDDSFPEEEKLLFKEMLQLLIDRAESKNGVLDTVRILYPEDCSDLKAFVDFANLMNAYVDIRVCGGAQIIGWFQNYKDHG